MNNEVVTSNVLVVDFTSPRKLNIDDKVLLRDVWEALGQPHTHYADWVKLKLKHYDENANDFHVRKKSVMNNIGKIIETVDHIVTVQVALEIASNGHGATGQQISRFLSHCLSLPQALAQREEFTFTEPKPRAELGGEMGLTLHEVAQSLGIEFKHAKEAIEKTLNDYSLVEAPTTINMGPIRGMVMVKSYILGVDDAKFFVASYRNAIGKSYLRYLIQCEKRSDSLLDLLAQPENAIKVFQVLADRNSRITDLENQKAAADKRAFSSMGTAGALSKKVSSLGAYKELRETLDSFFTSRKRTGLPWPEFSKKINDACLSKYGRTIPWSKECQSIDNLPDLRLLSEMAEDISY